MSSVLNTDCNFMFCMMRGTKLDLIYINFELFFTRGSNLCVNLNFDIIEEVATM